MLHAAEADSRDRSETHPELWSSNLPNTYAAKIDGDVMYSGSIAIHICNVTVLQVSIQ